MSGGRQQLSGRTPLDVCSPATSMHSMSPDQTHAAMRAVKGHISSVMKLKRQLDRIKSIANEYMNKQMCK